VWVVTRNEGIHIRDKQGAIIGRIGKDEGLPPSDRGAMLHPIEPGRVLAVGSLGLHERAWCAMLDIRGDRPTVNVFHTARRVLTRDDDKDRHALDPGIVFRPHWIHAYDDGGDGITRKILIGRYAQTHEARRRPLCIELPSLAVSVSDWELSFADHFTSAAYASYKGDMLEAGDFHALWLKPPGKVWPGGEQWKHWCVSRNREGVKNGGLKKVFLRHDGWLYVPGLIWFRLDPKTMSQEKLTPDRLRPPYNNFRYFGVSAHFGLVAWKHRGPYYRVDVLGPAE
jgi:hypothetical protein